MLFDLFKTLENCNALAKKLSFEPDRRSGRDRSTCGWGVLPDHDYAGGPLFSLLGSKLRQNAIALQFLEVLNPRL